MAKFLKLMDYDANTYWVNADRIVHLHEVDSVKGRTTAIQFETADPLYVKQTGDEIAALAK